MSELLIIEGIGSDEVELLEATGWTDLSAVAKANVDVLLREMVAANDMLRIVARVPERRKVERWVASAAQMLDPANRGKRGKNSAVSSRGSAPPEPQEETVVLVEAPIEEEGVEAPAAKTGVGVPSDDEEVISLVLADPVNFEADPEILVMLAAAPVAVPIPARVLAEQGISPSEIAIAPVLNRAQGDLDVRVVAEAAGGRGEPEATVLPEPAPAATRRTPASSAVKIGGEQVAGPTGRRGFDSSRVRTIEEAQGDAPPVRPTSSPSGMEDERIALLRAPRPETNKGRKPGSRFFIRGVLHDQPLKVWFGGFFAVMLQLSIPLAVIAAPLLILHDEMPLKFPWVPKWIIAFPLAVPVFGLGYALVSARAKCRVCAQRIYVPKQCLKNKKAHRLPFIGHIGALALHVMTFKWFNCTFCGTSIRIKK